MSRKLDLAYCAGLIDGEGHIGIKRTKSYKCQGRVTPGYHARIGIKMVSEEAITFFSQTMGGWHWTEPASLANGRPYCVYQATDAKAETILRELLPYLKVKRASAEAVIQLRELQATGKQHRTKITGYRNFPNAHGTPRQVANKSYSDEYIAMCDALYIRCKELNHAGLT